MIKSIEGEFFEKTGWDGRVKEKAFFRNDTQRKKCCQAYFRVRKDHLVDSMTFSFRKKYR